MRATLEIAAVFYKDRFVVWNTERWDGVVFHELSNRGHVSMTIDNLIELLAVQQII